MADNQEDVERHGSRARVAIRIGQYEKAIADFAIELSKNKYEARREANVRSRQAACMLLGGHPIEAESTLQMAIATNRQTAVLAWNDLAALYVNGRQLPCRPEAAAPLAERAVQLEPQNGNYATTLGIVLFRRNSYKPAFETLDQALARCAGRYGSLNRYYAAMCLWQLGEKAKAHTMLLEAERLHLAVKNPTSAHRIELRSTQTEARELLGLPPAALEAGELDW